MNQQRRDRDRVFVATAGTSREAAATGPGPGRPSTIWERTGGWTGLFESSFPTPVFVVVSSAAGLTAGLVVAIGTALVFVAARVARRQPLRPALAGFVGIAISSYLAYRTGEVKNAFLPDIWWSLTACTILLASVFVRFPLVGVVWSMAQRAPMWWRHDPLSRRGYTLASLALAAVFGARFVVNRWLYDADRIGWLVVAKITLGYPLTALGLVAVVWSIRRADRRLAHRR